MSIRIQEIDAISNTVIYHPENLDSLIDEREMKFLPIIYISVDLK